jgi:hypothetical protein
MRIEVVPDRRGDWKVLEGGREAKRFIATKKKAEKFAKEVAQPGDTIQVFNKDETLHNEFMVTEDGATAAYSEGRSREDHEGDPPRRREREGIFGAGIF